MRLFEITTGKRDKEWVNLDAVTLVSCMSRDGRPAQLELHLFNGVAHVSEPDEIKEIARILGIALPAS